MVKLLCKAVGQDLAKLYMYQYISNPALPFTETDARVILTQAMIDIDIDIDTDIQMSHAALFVKHWNEVHGHQLENTYL